MQVISGAMIFIASSIVGMTLSAVVGHFQPPEQPLVGDEYTFEPFTMELQPALSTQDDNIQYSIDGFNVQPANHVQVQPAISVYKP